MKNMKFVMATLAFTTVTLIIASSISAGTVRFGAFETVSPEEAGISAVKLDTIAAFCEAKGSAALLILHDGKVVLAWGEIDKRYIIHSIRKSMLNSLLGIYVERGIIDTSATLEELGIDDMPSPLTKAEKRATVADLLRSRSGVYHPAAAEAKVMSDSRPERGSHEPDAFFYYNNWDFNVLGTIFEQETGEKIFEVYHREIARPLGMKHFEGSHKVIRHPDGGEWDTDGIYMYEESKSMHPAYHFNMSAHDMALYGLLYMNDGRWNGRQIVPVEWIAESTKRHSIIMPEIGLGYGFLWNVFPEDSILGRCFFHTGAGIHLLFIAPDRKIVIVHRVDTLADDILFTGNDMYTLFDLITAAIREAE